MPTVSEFDRLKVVLVSPRNPLNIGAAARAMSNFGFFQLRVVNPYSTAFRRARSAVGAAELLASAKKYTAVADAVADCSLVVGTTAVRHRDLMHPLRRLEQGARLIRKKLASGQVALLFGSEKFGLSNEDLAHCHWLMRIPTSESNISMNLGQAVAVCLYELIRNAKAGASREKSHFAQSAELERVGGMLLEALHASYYVKPQSTTAEERVRRLIRRMKISSSDASILQGMLRKILWKLHAEQNVGKR